MSLPFDEGKYNSLMSRLEAVEVRFSQSLNNKDFRLDSSFWTTAIIKNNNLKYDKIGNILVKSQYGISISMNEENKGYPIYRMNEITNMLCDLQVDKYADIEIPLLNINLQNRIVNHFEKANKFRIEAQNLYISAQNLLLSELGIADYTPTNEGVSVKTFADSFGKSGRLDAEYYQPKYDEIINEICKFKHNNLGKLVSIKKSIEPGSEYYGNMGVPFVRVSNLSKFEISEPDIKIPFNTVKNINELFPKKDTILLTKDGSVGIAYKVTENMNCVTSGAILHLNVYNKAEILPDYLTLILNSLIVQFQAERDAGGSIIQHWKPSEIEQVIIPILDIEIQKQITDKIQESFALRKKSAELLDCAKQAVEMAIEQGENVAMKWLEGKENE